MATTEQAERLRRIDALADGFRARARALDDEGAFPEENFAELRAAGLLALTAPGEFGGEDLWWDGRYRPYYELLHHLARIDSVTAQLLQVHSHALGILSRLASPEQARALLPGIVADGRLLASVGSEARPGGEARRHRAHGARGARRRLAPDVLEVLRVAGARGRRAARLDRRARRRALPGARRRVLVPRDAPEVTLVDQWDVLGMRATVSWGVRIEDYVVPPERLVGAPGAWTSSDPRTFTLAFAANHLGAAAAALDFTTGWVRERPELAGSEYTRVLLGGMSSELFAAESAMWAAADLWDAGRHDDAELASVRTLHLAKRLALDLTQRAFDVCGARATFRDQPLERLYRDVRTFTLHFRDEQYMHQVGQAMLDEEFHAKGYAGASTFPEGQGRRA